MKDSYGNRKEENDSSSTDKCSDPRVRAFIRSYAYQVDQEVPEVILFTQSMLRDFFGAYQTQSGSDPLIPILVVLEDCGFALQAGSFSNELVLPVRRMESFMNHTISLPPCQEN